MKAIKFKLDSLEMGPRNNANQNLYQIKEMAHYWCR